MILSIDDINQIVTTEQLLQKGHSKETFILECFKAIRPKLTTYFKNDYLFFNVYYMGGDFTLKPIRLESGDSVEAKLIAKYLKLAESRVSAKKSKSFTEIILRNALPGLVLHNAKEPVVIGNVLEQDVTAVDYKNSLAKKLREKKSSIDQIAEVYNELAKDYEQPFFIHFIRPFASHEHYNGIFLLFLRRLLTDDEYTELALVWGKILSEPQIDELSKVSNLRVLDNLNKELSHTWNGYFESLRNTVISDIIPAAASGDLQLVEQVKDHLLAIIEPAARVQRFFTYMDKASEANPGKIPDEVLKELQPELIDIKEMVERSLQMLHSYFNRLDSPNKAELKAISAVRNKLQDIAGCLCYHNKAAIEIILANLLKNALVHSPASQKHLEVQISQDRVFVNISIINNGLMPETWVKFINQKNGAVDHIEFAYGIRTVKRITTFKFPQLTEQLQINAKRLGRGQKTEVCIKIPV